MSYVTALDKDRQREQMFLIRSICLIGGIVYPLWSFIYRYILPESHDPIGPRLMISALAGLNIALTFFKIQRSNLIPFLYASILVMTGHLVWISLMNDFHPFYQMGIMVLICVSVPFYETLPGLFTYIGVSTALFLTLLFLRPLQELLIFYMACATVFVVSTYALFIRLTLIEKLRASRVQFAASADRIAAINRDVSSIMENIQLGVFTIESQAGEVGAQYSHALEDIVGYRIPPGHTIHDILRHTDLSDDHRAQVHSVVASIGDDPIAFTLNSHVLPQECQFKTPGGGTSVLEWEWSVIVDTDRNQIQKILVSLRDVTEFRNLMHQNEEKKKELKLILEIVAIDKSKVVTVFTSIRKLLDHAALELQDQDRVAPETLRFIFREIHTIKGLARSFHLETLANLCHGAEDQMNPLKEEKAIIARSRVELMLQPLHEIFRDYTTILTDKFGVALDSEVHVSLTYAEIDWIIHNLKTALTSGEDFVVHVQEMYDFILSKSLHSLTSLLAPFLGSLGEMAAQLEKPAPRIDIQGDDLGFLPEAHDLLQSVFAHIIRNAIDHGIEDPAERLAKGKSREGLISIMAAHEADALHIYVRDDGRGLNLQGIQDTAVAKGLLGPHETPTREQLSLMIFKADFSTRKVVNSISGRGVGMEAVQTYLKSFGGTIRIEFLDAETDFASFRFHITLPQSVLDPASLERRIRDTPSVA
ncbi:MAG TPA: ATP-binding protein [Oligoflexus sp.]|uniref:ATP-binding protein n=1 Tax=Oligoflexus sp. TaxID=1971216 RepID=UPI002D807F09|nr:ATP-binding protein [Oligoflexus sp.]HET9239749.1 ATP-binding protein [Oligoflexus sp.]